MATSGSISQAVSSHNTLYFNWSRASCSIPDNTSTVYWELVLTADKYGKISVSAGSPWSVTVNGTAFSGTTDLSVAANSQTVLASGTVVISHNPDGTKSFSFSYSQTFNINFASVGYVNTKTASGTGTLDTIPRASVPTFSAQSVALGSPVTIYTNKAASFTHKLTYSFGNVSGTIAENVVDSCTWTPPASLATQIPNTPSGSVVITCITYDGSTQVGAAKPVSLTLTVPDTIAPVVTATWTDASGAFDAVGTYVKLVSKLQVNVAAKQAYGSAITSVSMTLGGKPYTGGAILVSGDMELVITAVDARGKTGEVTYSVTVADYAVPALNLSASRCTEDGTADDTGSFAMVTITGHVTQVNNANVAALKLIYGSISESIAVSVGEISHTQIIPADPDSTLAIAASLSDALLTTSRSMVLSTGYATMDFLKGGKGIAFGATATKEGFECAMDAVFKGHISVPTPIQGTDAVNLDYMSGVGNYVAEHAVTVETGKLTVHIPRIGLENCGLLLIHGYNASGYSQPFTLLAVTAWSAEVLAFQSSGLGSVGYAISGNSGSAGYTLIIESSSIAAGTMFDVRVRAVR